MIQSLWWCSPRLGRVARVAVGQIAGVAVGQIAGVAVGGRPMLMRVLLVLPLLRPRLWRRSLTVGL